MIEDDRVSIPSEGTTTPCTLFWRQHDNNRIQEIVRTQLALQSSELFRQLAVSNANAERAIEVAEARAAAAEEEKERQAAVLAKRLHDADVVSQAQQQVLAGATRQYQEMAARLAQAKVERENALYVATLSTSEVNRLNSEQNEANNRHAMESARQAQHVDFVTASATDAIQRQAEAAAAEVRCLENLSMLQNQELAELRERVHRFETIQQTAGPRDARRVPQHNRGAQDADGPGRTPQRQGTPTAQQSSFVTPAQVDDFDDGENDYFGEMEDDPNDNDSQTR
ncbi:hypothetical protein Ae201684_004608 [Aphanomyces euteiches]|uniref:Uncharacterized protein n=1 Tax=Aphanomyces euteiches TaxID=100861 RepID=A0A6G0XHX9_9STRA|nr:hypothetical protein Ae201684_004608 [Aphanomyces euteiches]